MLAPTQTDMYASLGTHTTDIVLGVNWSRSLTPRYFGERYRDRAKAETVSPLETLGFVGFEEKHHRFNEPLPVRGQPCDPCRERVTTRIRG